MKKKLTVLLLAASLFISASPSVLAAGILENPCEQAQMEISPRYIGITQFTPTLSKTGKISCSIRTTNYDYSLSVDLQQYIDGSWEDIESWSENGYRSGVFSASSSLERGQKYRVCAYVEVYDDSENVIETATKYSSTVTA